MANRDEIDQIKEKLNIVDVVREYVSELKHTGRNYFACCPFHSEKTPSFSVNEDMQRFKCFGCGESGDVINFIEKIEGIDFPRAIELSASRAGIELKKDFNPYQDKIGKEKKRLYEANQLVANYYHYILSEHKLGEMGREYARLRKFSKGAVTKFLIGFAPDGYENLKNYMVKKGYDLKELVKWSILVEKNGKVYDKFRKRLMFPIFSHVGDVIGFSGRVIDKDDIPKYLNSSETLVYKKSNVLYGLFQSKDDIRKSRTAILVEGNIDIPTAFRAGIHNVVAPMGTALTTQQLELIKRYADNLHFAFDSDEAGEKALIRGFEMAEKVGLNSRAINLGTYTDLDEFLNKDLKSAKDALESSSPVLESIIVRKIKKVDLSDAKSKSRFINEIVPLLGYVQDDVEKTHYVQLLAKMVEVDEDIIWKKSKSTSLIQKESVPSGDSSDRGINKSALSAEQEFIAFLLQYPDIDRGKYDLSVVGSEYLVRLFENFKNENDFKKAINQIDSEEDIDMLTNLYTRPLGEFESIHEVGQYLEKLYRRLEKNHLTNQLNTIQKQISKAEMDGSDISPLLTQQRDLLTKLKRVQTI
jgi:DNA primase